MVNWGAPRKSFEEEMSKEAQSKRRHPSVIARLVSRDRMSSSRLLNRQQKRSYINQHGKHLSLNIQENCRQYGNLRNSGSLLNQQQLKDVHEDLGVPDISDHRSSSRWDASSMLSKNEMAFIQQSIEARRLCTDGKLHESMVDSGEDLLLKYVQQPRPLLAKCSNDYHAEPSCSSWITILNPSESTMYDGNSMAWKSATGISSKHSSTSHLDHKDCLLPEPHNGHKARIFHKAPRIQLAGKIKEKPRSARIVVLKPHHDQEMHSVVRDNFKEVRDDVCFEGTEAVLLREVFSNPISEETCRIARRVTRSIRGDFNKIVHANSSVLKGYEGDVSSCNGSDCGSFSEVFRLSTRKPFSDNKLHNDLYGTLAKSSVHKVANRRLTERWKMNQRYQDLELVAESISLGEMLSFSDRETSPNELNPKVSHRRAINRPLGISSRDGWKDETTRTSSRSRSLPPSRGKRSHKKSMYHDKFVEDKYVTHNNPAGHSGSMAVKGNLNLNDELSYKCSKFRGSKAPVSPYQHMCINGMESKVEANFEIQMEANVKDAREQQLMLQMAVQQRKCKSRRCDVVMNGSKNSSQSYEFIPEKSTVHDQQDSNFQELHKGSPERSSRLQCLGSERDSSESSKDADHESPVSVLEVPFPADPSGYSCIERVNAEFHEFKNQLQLITKESGIRGEASNFVSMEEQFMELSPARGNHTSQVDDWESCYALDALTGFGLEESGFDLFRNDWHSPVCPLDPNLFDELEEKYEHEATGSWSERKFLFDTINFALVEIFQEHVDLFPWVMPKLAGLSNFTKQKEWVRVALQEKMNREYGNQDISKREVQWSDDDKAEIDIIGSEIEKMLIDDMIEEVLDF